jgi:hypothetical protein
MKHVGKMKNNSARVAVVYRTLPGEPMNALVVGTNGLPDAYHDSLMELIESESGQQANELADILAVRRFPDGAVMLNWLHSRGQLKKVPTNMVVMTPNTQTQLPLDELNQLIATQKNVRVEELAVNDGSQQAQEKAAQPPKVEEQIVLPTETVKVAVPEQPVTASDLRSMADKLFKEAQALRKKADEMDPPAKKAVKTVKAEA